MKLILDTHVFLVGEVTELKRGQRVRHEPFGDGSILTIEGKGQDAS